MLAAGQLWPRRPQAQRTEKEGYRAGEDRSAACPIDASHDRAQQKKQRTNLIATALATLTKEELLKILPTPQLAGNGSPDAPVASVAAPHHLATAPNFIDLTNDNNDESYHDEFFSSQQHDIERDDDVQLELEIKQAQLDLLILKKHAKQLRSAPPVPPAPIKVCSLLRRSTR